MKLQAKVEALYYFSDRIFSNFKPFNVGWDMNIVPFAFFEIFFWSCLMDVNQSSEYCKKRFQSHGNSRNGKSDSLKSNL